jgi:hypothetical protein
MTGRAAVAATVLLGTAVILAGLAFIVLGIGSRP